MVVVVVVLLVVLLARSAGRVLRSMELSRYVPVPSGPRVRLCRQVPVAYLGLSLAMPDGRLGWQSVFWLVMGPYDYCGYIYMPRYHKGAVWVGPGLRR